MVPLSTPWFFLSFFKEKPWFDKGVLTFFLLNGSMSDALGRGTLKVEGRKPRKVDVYGYHDPDSGVDYRSVFIPEEWNPEALPQTAVVKWKGERYVAEKFGNPNNQVPTFDFTLKG